MKRSSIATGIILAASLALSATGSARAEIFKYDDMIRGITTTRAQCTAHPQALWLNVDQRDFCVRYYISSVGGTGASPVVFLQGDYFGSVNANTDTWQWLDPADDKNIGVTYEPFRQDINANDLLSQADAFSKTARTTAIYLARIGVDGTSGFHVFRKTNLELHLMNAALDGIKQRYGFQGFHLAGQSGGALLVGGLAGLRHDINCAVAGSGPLAGSYRSNFSDPARTYFNLSETIPSLAQNRLLRMMMVTDRNDRSVPVAQQTPFAEKMLAAGRPVPQFFVEATDKYHHGAVDYTRLVVAGCALGRSDGEIAAAVNTLIKRNSDYTKARRLAGLE
jgi:hypothetical protein